MSGFKGAFDGQGKPGISLMTVCLELLQSLNTGKLPEDNQITVLALYLSKQFDCTISHFLVVMLCYVFFLQERIVNGPSKQAGQYSSTY